MSLHEIEDAMCKLLINKCTRGMYTKWPTLSLISSFTGTGDNQNILYWFIYIPTAICLSASKFTVSFHHEGNIERFVVLSECD